MKQVSFLNETAGEMKARLDLVREMSIGEMVDRDVEVARPDTPLIDALMMIKNKQYVVPVVDNENKLVGAISFFSVLYGLNEEYDREKAEKQKATERKERKQEHEKEGEQ